MGVIANSRFEIGNKQDEIVLYCCVNEQNNHQRQWDHVKSTQEEEGLEKVAAEGGPALGRPALTTC